MIIEMGGFYLREVQDDDHKWLVELHNDPNVLNNITNPNPISLEQHLKWWNIIKNDSSQKRLIFCDSKTHERIGFTKFYSIDNSNFNCILGADIHKDFRGKGFAKTMWCLMIEYCFSLLKMHRVHLTTAIYNTAGQRTYESVGFIREAYLVDYTYRFGKFCDALQYYMTEEIYQHAKKRWFWLQAQ